MNMNTGGRTRTVRCPACLRDCEDPDNLVGYCDCFVSVDAGVAVLTLKGAEGIGRRMRAIVNRLAKIEETACKQERTRLKAEMIKPPEEMAWEMYCRLYDKYGGVDPRSVPEEAAKEIAQTIMDERVAKAEGNSGPQRLIGLVSDLAFAECRDSRERDRFYDWLSLEGHYRDSNMTKDVLRELFREFRQQVVGKVALEDGCAIALLVNDGVIPREKVTLFREWLHDQGHINPDNIVLGRLHELWGQYQEAE